MENIIITKVINEYGDEFDGNWNLNTEKRRIEKSSIYIIPREKIKLL